MLWYFHLICDNTLEFLHKTLANSYIHRLSFSIIPQFCKHFKCGSSNLSKMPLHLWLCKCFSLVGATCGRPRAFTERPYGCGGLNLSTDLLLWGIYIKKCISPVRICRKPRNDARAELRAEMHLQNFEKLQSRKKRRNLSKSPLLVCSPSVGLAFLRKSHGG